MHLCLLIMSCRASILSKHCDDSACLICRALLNAPMREGQEGDVDIQDVRKPVFQALLYFTYTDQLPEVRPSPFIGSHL